MTVTIASILHNAAWVRSPAGSEDSTELGGPTSKNYNQGFLDKLVDQGKHSHTIGPTPMLRILATVVVTATSVFLFSNGNVSATTPADASGAVPAMVMTTTTWTTNVGSDSLSIGAQTISWTEDDNVASSGTYDLVAQVKDSSGAVLVTYDYSATSVGTSSRETSVMITDFTGANPVTGGRLYDDQGAVIRDTATTGIKSIHNWIVADSGFASSSGGTPIAIACG